MSEFFCNMKSIPDKTSSEYDAFFENERHKVEYGVTINGIFIPGWLYWHTNHWKIFRFIEDDFNKAVKRSFSTPELRDNEWIIAEYREQAIREKKGLMIVGSRRLGKSELECSVIGRSATIFEGSENVIAAGNTKDLKLISDKIDRGLNSVHPYFKWGRIENDWKTQVTLGVKDKDGNRFPYSYILPRNLDDGLNTEAIAGVTAKELVIDEGAKFLFLRALEAAIPAFTSPFGWACSPLIVCTGGSFEKGADAEKLHLNPEAYNFLSVKVKDEEKKFSLFISGEYRMEAKVPCKLGEWLEEEKDIKVPKDSELYNLNFLCKDSSIARELIDNDRLVAKKANDQEAYLKTVMYYPYTPEECFMSASYNMFNSTAARVQKQRILADNLVGDCVFLEHDGEKIIAKFTNKRPIMHYPTLPADDKDAPVVIWEHPIVAPPLGLYVAGVDPYRQGKSEYSSSLGAVYIFKRLHDLQSEKFQDMIVASYVARPEDKDKWSEQARLLIKYYNALTLVENDEMSFIEYMKNKGDFMYLQRQPPWLQDVAKINVKREYGMHRSNPTLVQHLHDILKNYLDSVLYQEKDEKGSVIREVKGVGRIKDPMLLEEIMKYTEDANADRIVAFELALAQARHMDPMGKISSMEDPRIKELYKKKSTSSLFGGESKLFRSSTSIRKLFG